MDTVSGIYFKNMIAGCIANGADARALYDLVDGGTKAFDNPLNRFSGDSFINVLNTAVSLTGDQNLGIKAGLMIRPGSITEIGNVLTVCDTLAEAMNANYRYQPLIQQFGSTQIDVKPEAAELCWTPSYDATERYRYFIEYLFTGYVVIGRWLIFRDGQDIIKIDFRHSPPANTDLAHQIFGENISYNSERDCLSFLPELAVMPLATANPDVKTLLFARLDKQLADLGMIESVTEKVIHLIHTVLPKGRPSLSDISELMGMSVRTLRRRLSDEGVTFRELLVRVRKEACDIYLKQGTRSYAQIAQVLGFSDQSAFSRAFGAWYGMTPKAYQSQQGDKL